METPEQPEPFVGVFLEEVAGAFLIPATLGSAYHFANGRIQAVRNNMPRICRMSCKTAGFWGIATAIGYAMASARGKEETALDFAVAIGGASGIMALRKGVRYAGPWALIGGALGGALGAGIIRLEEKKKAGDPARAR